MQASSSIFLENISINNFRNIEETTVSLGAGLNLFIGDNGHGKTNFLEAIALSCALRPMQALHNRDLIKAGHAEAHLRAQFSDAAIAIDIKEQGKRATIDGKGIKSALKLNERTPVVSFIPLELSMIVGGANLRRRALDAAACSLFFDHYQRLKAYEKILLHRNRLLKSWPLDQELLSSFSHLLIKEGAAIMHVRQKTLEALGSHMNDNARNILGGNYQASLSYHSGQGVLRTYAESDCQALLKEKSMLCRAQEQIRKITLFGPHLDDMIFFLNEIQAKNYASRGQMRALVLAFKLAHMEAVYRLRGNAPIVILDDIVSELDEKRKHNLVALIKCLGMQAFFSATDITSFGDYVAKLGIFSVRNGRISPNVCHT